MCIRNQYLKITLEQILQIDSSKKVCKVIIIDSKTIMAK